jgi:exopolyphosphatase/guanosine-5'-triphosphate,3'-diphosphate pyrophosphatase
VKTGHFAIINIGASAFRMLISEYLAGNDKTLEYLIKPLSLGRDTFSKGYITLDNVYRATKILKDFKTKMDEYNIGKNYRALCTSGVREAQNRYFFIDHMKINTGLELNILDPADEIYIKYVGIRKDIKKFNEFEKKGLLFANISSGNVTISIHKDGIMLYSAALPYGSLRLNEIFKEIPVLNKFKAYHQYVQNMFYTIKAGLPAKFKFQYIVCSGSSINLLTDSIKPEKDYLTKNKLLNFFEKVKTMDVNDIVKTFNIRQNDADILLPTLTTYINLLTFTGKDVIYFSQDTFPRVLSLYYTKTIIDKGLNDRLRRSFYFIGERYNFDKNHAKIVTKFALKLFDNLKSIHSLGSHERFLLEISSILHELGYYINAKNHEEHSFHIIKAINLPGITKEDISIIALIALLHRDNPNKNYEEILSIQPIETRLLIYKLVSILRVADALDANHTQLIKDIEVTVGYDRLKILGLSLKHPFLEYLSFTRKSKLFLETFGIKTDLQTRIIYE